jgi:hypothetical protein
VRPCEWLRTRRRDSTAAFPSAALLAGAFFLTLGAIGPMVAIGAGVFALAAFPYIVWDWWPGRLISDLKSQI